MSIGVVSQNDTTYEIAVIAGYTRKMFHLQNQIFGSLRW